MSQHVVYKLFFGEEPHVCYIGYSSRIKGRIAEHPRLSQLKTPNLKNNWIKSRLNRGWELQHTILETYPTAELALNREVALIAEYHKTLGITLKNMNDGGSGNHNHCWTEEMRQAQSARMMGKGKGRKFTEDHRRKIGLAHKGKTITPEHREAVSRHRLGKPTTLGRKHTVETRALLAERARMRPPVSDEARRKMSLAGQSRKPSPESVKKGADKRRGQKMPESAKATLSAQARRRYADAHCRNRRAKIYDVLTPHDGRITVLNLSSFCVTHGLDPGGMVKTLRKNCWHKGYQVVARRDQNAGSVSSPPVHLAALALSKVQGVIQYG